MVDLALTGPTSEPVSEPTIRFVVNGMSSSLPANSVHDMLTKWNDKMLAQTYKEAEESPKLGALLFGLKAGVAGLFPIIRMSVETARKDPKIPEWVKPLLLTTPQPPRHTDMLGFLCAYLIDELVHVASSGVWSVTVVPVKAEDSDIVNWKISDFQVKFDGSDHVVG